MPFSRKSIPILVSLKCMETYNYPLKGTFDLILTSSTGLNILCYKSVVSTCKHMRSKLSVGPIHIICHSLNAHVLLEIELWSKCAPSSGIPCVFQKRMLKSKLIINEVAAEL